MTLDYVVVVSTADPVAAVVAERWGTPPATDYHVDGTPIRRLSPRVGLLKRSVLHIRDDALGEAVRAEAGRERPTLVFPSIHRSQRGVPSLTVHPLGNPGPTAEVGGRPRTLVPTDPLLMAAALRSLGEGAPNIGVPATYEATHHGPAIELPAFFVEIGYDLPNAPPPEAVGLLAQVLPSLSRDPTDRVALGVGGGHYVPHFTELALRRRWAFGHLLSRHTLPDLVRSVAEAAVAATPGAEGIIYARAEDARHPALEGVAARLNEKAAPLRERAPGAAKAGAPRASGT